MRVLVLDDEPALLQLAATYCSRLGFEPITTSDPDEAVRIVREHDTSLAAAIIDYLMPRRDGVAVLGEIRQVSDVDVYLTSGYMPEALDTAGVRDQLAGFIAKPFTFEEFEAALKSTRDSD